MADDDFTDILEGNGSDEDGGSMPSLAHSSDESSGEEVCEGGRSAHKSKEEVSTPKRLGRGSV